MNKIIPSILLAGVALTPAQAAEYRYEVGLDYDFLRYSRHLELGIVPPLTTGDFFERRETRDLSISGTWYVNGIEPGDGPLSRAAFLSRASKLSFSTQRSDESYDTNGFYIQDPGDVSSFAAIVDQDRRDYALDGRYVDEDSGWYGFGSAGVSSLKWNGSGTDRRDYSLGVGRYIGDSTALELSYEYYDFSRDAGEWNAHRWVVGINHIGQLTDRWKWGLDATFTTDDSNGLDGGYDVAVSLFPTRELAFGLSVTDDRRDIWRNEQEIGAFASWFPHERVELTADYGIVDHDDNEFSGDRDTWRYGLGARFRF